ncbi:unnamed protein product, partial [Mesorhabditis belari]|uniref:Uncharacterized protein n=1 Tax=Mesorhabditis belari TaxID=2138241 RepID=A0AAF3FJE0_9BILA
MSTIWQFSTINESIKNALEFSLGPLLISDYIQSPIVILTHLFTFYLIINDTPAVMNVYKRYLLYTQFWLFTRDLMWSIFVRPVYIYPSNANACMGLFSFMFQIDCHYQFSLINLFISMTIASLTTLMIYRRNQLTPPGKYHFTPRTIIAFNVFGHFIELSNVILFSIAGLESEKVDLSRFQYHDFTATAYTLNLPIVIWFMSIFVIAIWTCIFTALFVFSIFFQLAQAKERMSPKTFELQKYFSNTLLLQLGAVFVFFLFPIAVIMLGIYFQIFNTWIINSVIILPSYFSVIYSWILLLMTPVYLNAIKAKFGKKMDEGKVSETDH